MNARPEDASPPTSNTSAERRKKLNKTAESCKPGAPRTWPAGHFSQLTLTFTPMFDGRGTQLSMVQTNVPAEKYESINGGWRQYYWTKMSEYLRARKVAPVRRFLEEFKNHANIDVVDETWTPDAVLHVTGFPLPPGHAMPRRTSAGRSLRPLATCMWK
ncbi:MAG: hypothetical protein DMG32_10755 [Acidobacteria bacterium]|nr:MAG: hypothetical protein DMG32_10755 [Acidobacteriota bacterium]